MAINIQNIVAALEAKVAAATSTTETQELIVIIKSIKAAGQQTVVTYGDVPNLPTASADNAGNLAYVAAVGKIYYSNGTTWTEVGSGSSGGGGGTAYDQDLNTTDDVVFNSALVGDVSIIGNEISAVDAYGLGSTLIVDGDLDVTGEFNVKLTKTTTGTTSVSYSTPNSNSYSAYYNGTSIEFSSPSGWTAIDLFKFSKVAPVKRINFSAVQSMNWGYHSNGGNFDVFSVEVVNTNTVRLIVNSNIDISGVGNAGGQPDNFQFYGMTWSQDETTSVTVDTNPINVSSTGVNVEGTFTVNGQPVAGGSGSSYDQDLNTTDDVVFNSALVGDVSIVGNEISGTDAYGNSDTLVVDGSLNVQFDTTTTATGTITLTSPPEVYYNGTYVQIGTGDGWTQQQVEQFANLSTGSIIDFTSGSSSYWGTFPRGYMTINYVDTSMLSYGVVNLYLNNIALSNQGGVTGIQTDYTMNSWSWTAEVTTGSLITPLSVTESGVNVEGTFTVNGLAVSTASTASFDQDLNTTDDVVFNSALIGDVSIVGNTISGIDSYGNANTLVVDGNLDVTKTEVITNSYNSSNGLAWGTLFADEYSGGIRIESYEAMNQFTQNLLSSIPTGARVSIQGGNGSLSTYTVTGLSVIPGMGGNSYVFSVAEPIVYQGPYNVFIAIETTFTTNILQVTETSVNISGNLTLADNIVTPTNTSTVVKWAKIIVGGQVYYTPLYQ